MSRKLKKILMLTIALGTLLLCFTFGAGAEIGDIEEYGDYDYLILSNDTVEILAYYGDDKIINIPLYIDQKKVVSIDGFKHSSVEKIIIPDGVTSIGENAFEYCRNLTSITIPNSVTSIGESAFMYCSSLKSVTIPNKLKCIEDELFAKCTNLESITIPESVSNIGMSVFYGCKSLKNITIPESVSNIGMSVFYGCKSLKNITIPKGVTEIKTDLFADCSNLESVILHDGIKRIGISAFYGCTSLKSIIIPKSVTEIDSSAFSNCTGIEQIKVDSDNSSYSSDSSGVLFNKDKTSLICYPTGKKDSSYKIPNGVKSINSWAFEGCANLKHIEIPNGIVSIERGTFSNCINLISVAFPKSLTWIDMQAFENCKSLNSITIPTSVEGIGKAAFKNCASLTKLTIPSSVTYIAEEAFMDCTRLEKITFHENLDVANTSFNNTAWYAKQADGLVYIGNSVVGYKGKMPENYKVVIKSGVRAIVASAFEGCKNIVSIVIPDSVVNIGAYAFYNCNNLEQITIGKGVKSIGVEAFYKCEKLTNVCYTGTKKQWDKIPLSHEDDPQSLDYSNYRYMTDAEIHFVSVKKEVVKSATCLSDGMVKCTCSCGETYVQLTEKIGHTEVKVTGKAATCTEAGLTNGKKCSVCDNVITAQKTIPATGHSYISKVTKLATCTTKGVRTYTCSKCSTSYNESIAKLSHNYKTTTIKATLSKNGSIVTGCSVCGTNKATVYYPKTITLSATSYTYDGKVKTPTVTVKDSKGNVLKEGTDYTVKYESGRKDTGRYSVKVIFKGKYSGSKTLTFKIAPKATGSISAVTSTSAIKLTWKKVTGADGYRIYQYNTKTKKWVKIKTITSGTTVSYKVKDLKAGTKYKFRVKAYTKDDGTIWGSNSATFETATKCKTPKISRITSTAKGKAVVAWSNVSGESGYQVYYSTKKDGEYKKVKNYSADTVKGSKSKLKSGKKYYFKVRAYTKTDSGVVYSAWSSVKSVKVK